MNIYDLIRQMDIEHKTIYDMPLRVTFYARVSTTKEIQLNSLDNQIDEFSNMIKANKNWTYINGYIDTVRGEHVDNRESFLQMMSDAKEDKFDLVIAKENSRFSRDIVDSFQYTRDLFRNNVGVLFLSDNLCTLQNDCELKLGIYSAVAQEEVRKLSSRVKFGHRKSIEKGRVLGNSRIIGYDYSDGKLYLNEQQAEIIRQIFELYKQYKSTRKVEELIYNLGFRGANGDNRISKNTISSIIQNPKYKGFYCGGKVQIEDYRTKKQRFLPQEEWVMYKDENIPQIVDEDLWNECNSILKQNSDTVRQQKRNPRQDNCFSGKLYCLEHNGLEVPLWRNSYSNRLHKDKNIFQYVCSHKKKFGADTCPTFPIYEHEMYDIMRKFFAYFKDDYIEALNEIADIYTNLELNTDNNKLIKSLENNIDKLNKKKDRLLDLYIDELISKEDYKIKNDDIETQIMSIQEQLSGVQSNSYSSSKIKSNIEKLKKDFTKKLSCIDNADKLSDESVAVMVNDFIDRIEIKALSTTEMDIIIKLKYGNQYSQTINKTNRNLGNIFLTICPPIDPACLEVRSPL